MRIIKILGIGRPNKGAELMALAVKEHFSQHGVIVVEKTLSDTLGRYRRRLNKLVGFNFPAFDETIISLLPIRLRSMCGGMLDCDVDVILDASGFAYGDKWGPEKLQSRLVDNLDYWKKNGVRLILLPQAFGPFSKKEFHPLLGRVTEQADMVFTRDQESYKHLTDVVGQRNNIKIKPDFTNLITTQKFLGEVGQVAIIPNSKMIEMQAVKTSKDYVSALIAAIKKIQEAGKTAFLLNHEGESDRRIIQDINRAFGNSLQVFESDDPAEIKSVIASAEYVISSRFHGLVSALSQNVPVIAMGWSHKYQELLFDYGVSEYLIDVNVFEVEMTLKRILDEDERKRLVEVLEQRSPTIKEEVRGMWRQIEDLLGLKEKESEGNARYFPVDDSTLR